MHASRSSISRADDKKYGKARAPGILAVKVGRSTADPEVKILPIVMVKQVPEPGAGQPGRR
jgi:hypothetical protein